MDFEPWEPWRLGCLPVGVVLRLSCTLIVVATSFVTGRRPCSLAYLHLRNIQRAVNSRLRPNPMNDDPTQLFPETHWKRHATEGVSSPARKAESVRLVGALHIELRNPVAPGVEAEVVMPAVAPMLN